MHRDVGHAIVCTHTAACTQSHAIACKQRHAHGLALTQKHAHGCRLHKKHAAVQSPAQKHAGACTWSCSCSHRGIREHRCMQQIERHMARMTQAISAKPKQKQTASAATQGWTVTKWQITLPSELVDVILTGLDGSCQYLHYLPRLHHHSVS